MQTVRLIYTVPLLHCKQYWICARHIRKYLTHCLYYILFYLLELSSNLHRKLRFTFTCQPVLPCSLRIYFPRLGWPILAKLGRDRGLEDNTFQQVLVPRWGTRSKAVSWSGLALTITENKVCCIWAVSCPKTQPGLEVSYKDRLLLIYLVLRRLLRELEDLTRCLGKV